MMLEYTEQQESIRQSVREFARKEIAPGAAERDATGQFDYELYRRVGELGIIGLMFPEEDGGSGSDLLTYCLALEEIARVDLSLSWTTFVSLAGAHTVAALGSEEQKALWTKDWVDPVIRGDATTSAGLTEPDAGSDSSRLKTRAVLDGDDWVINGQKIFITNAGLENNVGVMVLCVTDPETRRYETILVPRGTPGYTIGPPMKKMGLRSSDTRELFFDDCRVPIGNRFGVSGAGYKRIMSGFFIGRIVIASTALGLAEECLEIATAYAKEREAFGRPISRFQYVQGMLTDMALNVELGRLIRDKAAHLCEAGKPFAKQAAMAKWFITETAKQAADNAVQIFGGMGCMDECPASRYYRDIRAATIGEGTTQIQRYVVGREMGLLR
ncbi:MAG: acyl-CoA dehydrogenase family protein [Deltaproteobacteria bacterium]|nr:acyl-CoA dehydrogenase family protein [Deltaproteobacteria bacterium]